MKRHSNSKLPPDPIVHFSVAHWLHLFYKIDVMKAVTIFNPSGIIYLVFVALS